MLKVNPLRGQAKLGDRLLHMTFEAWIAFEVESGQKIGIHLIDLEMGLGCGDLVNWLCAFSDMTKEEATAVVSEAGFPEALGALKEVVQSYFGPLVEDKKANPPRAA